MRTANFRDDCLYAIAALLSITPVPDLSPEFAAQWTSFVNTRLRYAWCIWDWPELLVTQERAFRQIWRNDQDYFAGDEVYYLPNTTYYRATTEVVFGTPPTDVTMWVSIPTVDKYIAYDQPGQQPIGEVYGVFNFNPRLYPALQPPGLKFRPSEKGIDVMPYCGNSVFVNYKIPPSKFTTVPWQAGAYSYLDTVYWTDGNCYQCGVSSTTADPSDLTQWFKVPLPSTLNEFAKTAAAGDAADDQVTERTLLAEAEMYLSKEIDMLMAQGEQHFYSLRQPRRQWIPYGVAGFWWSVSAPWSGGFVSTLTDALYNPITEQSPALLTETGENIVTETAENIVVP